MTQAWESVRLEQVLIERRETPKAQDLVSGTVKVVSKISFSDGLIQIRQSSDTKTGMILAYPGDILVSGINASKGAIAIYDPNASSPIAATIHYGAYTPIESRVDRSFLWWLLRSKTFGDLLQQYVPGGIKTELKAKRFLPIPIPLPPLEEQRRIVARVESLAAQIAEARGLREQAIQERELTYYTALKKMRENLLEQHETKALGTVTKVTAGGTPSRENPTYWGGKIPWIKTGELFDSDIFDSEEHITQQGLEGSSAKLFPPETILIALYGQGQTRGRTGRLMLEASTNQACCAVLPSPDILESRFTQFWLQSLYKDMREQSQGGAQPNWNAGMIKDVLIVLPSLQIQQEILTKVDDFKSQISSLEQLQEATRLELNALLPSVLSKAFAGEL